MARFTDITDSVPRVYEFQWRWGTPTARWFDDRFCGGPFWAKLRKAGLIRVRRIFPTGGWY